MIGENVPPPPPALVERIKFHNMLFTAFGARFSAKKLGYIAEFTVKRTTEGIFDVHGTVFSGIDQLSERDKRFF